LSPSAKKQRKDDQMKKSNHISRLIACFLTVALLIAYLPTKALAASSDSLSDYENDEILVGYTDGSYKVFSYEDKASLASLLETLSSDETVTSIQPNYTYTKTSLSANDPLLTQQWALDNDGSFKMQEQHNQFPVFDSPFDTPSAPGQWTMPDDFGQPGGVRNRTMKNMSYKLMSATQQTKAASGIDINLDDAWKVYKSNRDVVVALIDTGVDYTHEELADSIWVNEDEIAGNGIDDDDNGYIDDVYGWNFYSNNNKVYTGSEDDHGTHGAGTIAAKADNGTGIAGIIQGDGVKIMIVKALGGKDGSGSTESIIKAIQYAEDNGASICNLSLGTSVNDPALYQAIANSSMLFVVAAGNDKANIDVSPCYPASYDLDNIISVANLNYNGSLHYSSNYGVSCVDLAAPGSYILSTTSDNGYSYMTGTSMAAPMVTAAAAMVYSYYKDITLADVKEILLNSVKKLDSLDGQVATGGMLDLGAALSYDISTLSGDTWDASKTTSSSDHSSASGNSSGSAPVITARLIAQNNRQYLQVQVLDENNDLAVTAYAPGTLPAEYFQGGSAGHVFTVDSNGLALFFVTTGGTYTFYACDKAGNETVRVIQITGKSGQGSSWPANGLPGNSVSGGKSVPGNNTPAIQ
jgi:subtilisin family serine protease